MTRAPRSGRLPMKPTSRAIASPPVPGGAGDQASLALNLHSEGAARKRESVLLLLSDGTFTGDGAFRRPLRWALHVEYTLSSRRQSLRRPARRGAALRGLGPSGRSLVSPRC